MPNGLTHIDCQKDGSGLNVHDSHLCLKLQADLSNIPKTPLVYCKKFGTGISKAEAEALARLHMLTPIQQELMDWHYCLYHLLFPKIFWLVEKSHLPEWLLECIGKLPLYVAGQLGAAHCCPWRSNKDGSGSICCPEHVKPGDCILMDQVVSAQPAIIPRMSGFLMSWKIWDCTTFCDNISNFV